MSSEGFSEAIRRVLQGFLSWSHYFARNHGIIFMLFFILLPGVVIVVAAYQALLMFVSEQYLLPILAALAIVFVILEEAVGYDARR